MIYKLTEDIEQALVGMLSAVPTEEIIGEAEVRALFKVPPRHDRGLLVTKAWSVAARNCGSCATER